MGRRLSFARPVIVPHPNRNIDRNTQSGTKTEIKLVPNRLTQIRTSNSLASSRGRRGRKSSRTRQPKGAAKSKVQQKHCNSTPLNDDLNGGLTKPNLTLPTPRLPKPSTRPVCRLPSSHSGSVHKGRPQQTRIFGLAQVHVQGSAKRWSPGCVNDAGKGRQKW